MANQVNKDAIIRFLAGYESDLSGVAVENGTVYFALKPDPLDSTKTVGSIYVDAGGKRILMSGESLAILDAMGEKILTKYIKSVDFGSNTGAQGKLTYIKGDGSDVDINVPSASASAAGFVTTGAQTFAGAKTFKSPIITTGGSYVHSATGTSGTGGYVKIATFKINGTYQNTPIIIELTDRVRTGSCVLNIQFTNANSSDPTLANFTYTGVNYNCHLHKSATSTWDLYVEKGEDYGQPTVVRFHKSPHMSKVAVTWTNAHADTIPSGAQPAVLGGNVANASKADSATKATGDGQGNNIYTTYLSDLTSTNNASIFTIQGIKKNGGNSPTTITINGATTEKAGLMTAEEQSFAGEKTFNNDITISGAKTNIQKEGSSTSWIYGRDVALVKLTSCKGYNAITSMKTTNGDWSYGVYTDDIAYWTYTPDAQYTAKDNKNYVQMKLTPAGKLITVNSETGHLFAKSVAIGSDNTNYKLYNIGTTYLADALTVDARATVDTLKISKTEMAKHIEFARGGFNYIATAANGCIAFLPNGASPEKDTSRLIVEDGGARPGATNTYNLGTPGSRWKNIYGNALNISGTSTLTGAVTLGGNLSVGGTLGVTGATTLSSTLTVTGKTVLSSVVEIGNDLTVTGAIFGKDKLTIGQADLNTNYTVYVNGSSYFKGNVTSNGTLHLTKTTDGAATADNSVALIIGPRDSTHLIADNNEIMAKSNGTAAGPLYLNNDGGQVVVGAGGFTTSGYVDATGGNGFRIRRSGVTYGRFYAITEGTTSVDGVGHLTLGNDTSKGTANNAAGVLRLYGLSDKYTDIRTVQGSGNYAYYFSNHGQTGYSIARASSSEAYGSTVKPVWFNSSGMVTAFEDTVGSTAIPVYMNEGAITQVKPADMFSELKWGAGTSLGPVINMTIGTQNRTATIPTATQTNSGVVIAGAQTFGGAKTFTNNVTVNGMMKIGRYIDFRSTNTTTNDYSVRFDAGTGDAANTLYLPDITGQVVIHKNNTQIGSGTKPVYVAASGAVTASTSSVGGSTTPMYLLNGTMTSCDYGVGALHATDVEGTDEERAYLLGTSSSSTGYRTTTYFDPEIYMTVPPGTLSCASVESRGNLYGGNNIYLRSGTFGEYARLYVERTGTACTTDGTAGATGVTYMYLGNKIAVSTAAGHGTGNSCGVLRIYGSSSGYTDIRCGFIHGTSGETLYLPRGTGQIVYHTDDTSIGGPDTPVYVTVMGRVMSCSTKLTDYVLKTGGTMTGNLVIKKASGTASFTATKIDTGTSVSFGVVLGDTNRGVYDNSLARWIIYSDGVNAGTELKLLGAVWNDYAEFRQTKDKVEPGRVVIETGRGDLKLSTERLQPGANVVSDTFGFAIGETKKAKTPLAVAGRVLVYTFEDKYSYKPGDAVCTGPNGTVSKMTREEIWKYPERIVGTVSEIPEYEIWESGDGPIQVNSRIWIKVK